MVHLEPAMIDLTTRPSSFAPPAFPIAFSEHFSFMVSLLVTTAGLQVHRDQTARQALLWSRQEGFACGEEVSSRV